MWNYYEDSFEMWDWGKRGGPLDEFTRLFDSK